MIDRIRNGGTAPISRPVPAKAIENQAPPVISEKSAGVVPRRKKAASRGRTSKGAPEVEVSIAELESLVGKFCDGLVFELDEERGELVVRDRETGQALKTFSLDELEGLAERMEETASLLLDLYT